MPVGEAGKDDDTLIGYRSLADEIAAGLGSDRAERQSPQGIAIAIAEWGTALELPDHSIKNSRDAGHSSLSANLAVEQIVILGRQS